MALFSQLLKWSLFFIILLGLLIGFLDYTNITVKSDKARQVLQENIKTYTGRDVTIDGDVYITISLSPMLLVEQIHIRNLDNFDSKDFVTISKVHVEVSLLPLLSGIFRLEEISGDHAKIYLIQKEHGVYNWSFDHVGWVKDRKAAKKEDKPKKKETKNRLALGVFNLTDVSIFYIDKARGKRLEKHFESVKIKLDDPTSPQAEILGNIQGYPYHLNFKAGTLSNLLPGKQWLLHGTGAFSGSKINIEANIQLLESGIDSNIDINIKDVNLGLLFDKLGLITGQDAATDEVTIIAKLHGTDLTELYELAEIKLRLKNGYWMLIPTGAEQGKEFTFKKITSFTSWGKPVELHLDGIIAGEVIKLDFKTNRLLEFFDDVHKLDVDLQSTVAGTSVSLKGTLDLPIKTRQFQLDISLHGKDLEKLNPIIEAQLPAFNDFSLTGKLLANNKGYILRSADASVGDSHFKASFVIETTLAKPYWTINIHSRQLQLNDFSFDIADLQQSKNKTVKTSKQKFDDIIALKPVRQFIDVAQSSKMHFNLYLKADQILSGEGILGKAVFQLQLEDNIINMPTATINLPGGSASVSANIEVIDNNISGNIKVDVDKLDYGIVARTFDAEAELDGVFSSRIDLTFEGNKLTNILDSASGQIDAVVWPVNTKPAKILDLWATNLYLILLPELNKKEAKVNCFVSLMTIKEGIMKEDFFAIDTTKLWIQGDFNVDFKRKKIILSLFPRSKTARFFAIQAPIRASGSFTDIKLNFNLLDLGIGYVSFLTSPLHVPVRWVFDGKPPEDGSATCEQFFDREHVERLHAEAKKKTGEETDEIMDADY